MTWLLAAYHPVSFFSLRPASATASGGQSLLVPTAFALKMALLSASIQSAGLDEGKRRFPAIRDLRIALRPPDEITIMKSFAKVRRPARVNASTREADIAMLSEKKAYPFQATIAYREFVQFGSLVALPGEDTLQIALATPDGEVPPWLSQALGQINYLGKRGGFVQLARAPEPYEGDEALREFVEVTRDTTDFSINGTLQMLDDCGPKMTFDHADIYSSKRITLGKERILRHVVLPYRLSRSSRGYSLYRREQPARQEVFR